MLSLATAAGPADGLTMAHRTDSSLGTDAGAFVRVATLSRRPACLPPTAPVVLCAVGAG